MILGAQSEQVVGGKESVFAVLREGIAEIIGQDAALIVGVTENSRFYLDLEMDSIEILRFAEVVQRVFGDRVDFQKLFFKKSLVELSKLTVGNVADYIVKAIAEP
jgi:acyl carrier protein